MNLNYYYIFYQVALHENITETAKDLNISQPSISRTISLLEQDLQQQLFIRSKNGVKLTKEGKILFEYVSRGINCLQKGKIEIDSGGKKMECLTLGASPLSIKSILPAFLKEFEKHYPDVNLNIQASSSIRILEDLQKDLIDIAVVPDPIEFYHDVEVIQLASFDNLLIGGPKYKFLLENHMLSLSDLFNYPFISLSQGTAGRTWLNKLYMEYGILPSPTIEVSTSDLIIPLVEHDLGLGIVSEIFAHSSLESGKVICLNTVEPLPKRNIVLCFKKTKRLNESGTAFLELMQNTFCKKNNSNLFPGNEKC